MKIYNPLQQLYNRASLSGDDKFCLFSSESDLNSAELWQKCNRIANGLVKYGVKPMDRVVIVGKNCRSMVSFIFASWLAQALVLPISNNYDRVKQDILVKQFDADYICDAINEHLTCLKTGNNYKIRTDIGKERFNYSHLSLERINETNGALCLYTSGSTGEPKGVILSLEALANGANNVIETFRLHADDIAFCVLPLTHINGLVTTLLAPLYSRGSVLFYQGHFFEDLENALDLISKNACTWMSAIPMHYSAMNSCENVQQYNLKLRFCRSAASSLPPNVLEKFENKYSIPLIETLGMTETAGQIFANPLPPNLHKAGSVGKPCNFDALILNDDGDIISDNQVGEIYVRGNAMMLGYIDDVLSSKRVFLNGWMKTGDLAKRDSDGYYYIVGRKKHMIIFAGINVPLGQIENVVTDREEVSAAVCIVRRNRLFGEVFDLFIELIPEASNVLDNLNKYYLDLKKYIDPYIPAQQALNKIVIVDNIPRTSVGKIDRAKIVKEE